MALESVDSEESDEELEEEKAADDAEAERKQHQTEQLEEENTLYTPVRSWAPHGVNDSHSGQRTHCHVAALHRVRLLRCRHWRMPRCPSCKELTVRVHGMLPTFCLFFHAQHKLHDCSA